MLIIKFIYSEKATKFCEISNVDLSYVVPVKSTVEILQNFLAFSEYMNFMICNLFLQDYDKFLFASVTKPTKKKKHEFHTILWRAGIVKSCRKTIETERLYQNLFLKVFLLYQSCNIQPKVIFSPLLKINWFGAGIAGNSSCNPSNLDSKVRLSSWKL